MFERILVPLDGSPRAELILSQVERILRRKDSEIILLRVVEVPSDVRFGRSPQSVCRTCERDLEEAHRYVDDLARRLEGRGVRARGRIAKGPAAGTILEQAKLQRATLIAMSTHGRSGLPRWLMGSVAEKVARSSPIPILLVRSFRPTPLGDVQSATSEELPFRRILVPMDGSPAASSVIDPAAELAELFDSTITVLHVQVPIQPVGFGETGVAPVMDPTPSEKDPITAASAERFGAFGRAVKRRTALGYPAEVILDVAHSQDIDLIAMASHGRSGFSRWFLGSVAERVLRHASVPLLLVRSNKTREASERNSKAKSGVLKTV